MKFKGHSALAREVLLCNTFSKAENRIVWHPDGRLVKHSKLAKDIIRKYNQIDYIKAQNAESSSSDEEQECGQPSKRAKFDESSASDEGEHTNQSLRPLTAEDLQVDLQEDLQIDPNSITLPTDNEFYQWLSSLETELGALDEELLDSQISPA